MKCSDYLGICGAILTITFSLAIFIFLKNQSERNEVELQILYETSTKDCKK